MNMAMFGSFISSMGNLGNNVKSVMISTCLSLPE